MNQFGPKTTLEATKESFSRVESALAALQCGKGIVLVDDDDRENEADLIFAAESITVAQMALMIRRCSGIVCLCLTGEKIQQLQLPMMVNENTSRNGTAFTTTIEAKSGVTTGVSAADRVHTIKTAISASCLPQDLARPGHVFPLRAQADGVLTRRGHTEGSVDLAHMAGLTPAAVLCELMNDDGTMCRLPEAQAFAREHDMPLLSVEDIVAYRRDMRSEAV